MKKNMPLKATSDFFVTERFEDVLILRFCGDFFHHVTSLDKKDAFFDYIDQVSEDREIKTIVINSSQENPGREEYLNFFLFESRELENAIHRFCNIINQLILKIISIDKIVIHICQGDLITLFLNIGLACDYRIVAKNTIFCNSYLDLGMLPKGGAPFFLTKLLGTAKTLEILLLNKELTAFQALEYGIVDLVVPAEKLEETALAVARRFSRNDARSLVGVKKLVNYSIRDLKNYLEFENQEILNRCHNSVEIVSDG